MFLFFFAWSKFLQLATKINRKEGLIFPDINKDHSTEYLHFLKQSWKWENRTFKNDMSLEK